MIRIIQTEPGLWIVALIFTAAGWGCSDSSSGNVSDTLSADTGSAFHSDSDTETATVEARETDSRTDEQPFDNGHFCLPLDSPSGNVTRVTPDDAAGLREIVASAQTGDTILFESGTYHLNGNYIWIATPGITLRSESGNPEDVILDGNYQTTEIVTVAASDCTIAEITIQRASTHPIHVTSSDGGNTDNTRIYRVHIVDPGEQAIKINSHNSAMQVYADDGEVACSSIVLTDAGRPHVNMSASPCYTGGVDAHQARGWTIRDNQISGFYCQNGLSEHAVHFWRGCRDTVVERNILFNNARGVGFGLATSGDARTYSDHPCNSDGEMYVGHVGGVVQNNFIFASDSGLFASESGFDCGICLWSACDASVLHNTIVSTGEIFSAIEWRFDSTSATIANNLATHPLRERDGATATLVGNMENANLAEFADAAGGDLHLTAGAAAIDAGISSISGLPTADIDGDPRDSTPDAGADER
jgi:hypothetical protein